jgi:hypothetical protein
MQRTANKILAILDDIRWTKHEVDYLAWNLVQNAPKPMLRRLDYLASAIVQYRYEIEEEHNDDTLF